MAANDPWMLEPAPLPGLRLGIPQGLPLRDLDQTVAARFSDATRELGRTGVRLSEEPVPLLDDMVRINAKATFAAAESFAIHRERLATRAADYDPFVRSRIEGARMLSAADYLAMLRGRAELARAMDARLSDLDGWCCRPHRLSPRPSPNFDRRDSPPRTVGPSQHRDRQFLWSLRNISAVARRWLPVGLMLVARSGQDHRLFRMALRSNASFRVTSSRVNCPSSIPPPACPWP
jgi:aspartyl-tRNA(Asn)/glutamyl-tRNA(Gln) amidotransferase subunit A